MLVRNKLVTSLIAATICLGTPTYAFAGFIFNEKHETYTVYGKTWNAIQKDIDKRGHYIPSKRRTFAGLASWKYTWNTQYKINTRGCKIKALNVHVTTTISTPAWNDYGFASKALKQHWDKFIKSLKIHEQEHVEIYREAGYEIYSALNRLGYFPTCDALGQASHNIVKDIDDHYTHIQAEYDRITEHGAKQSAYRH